MRIRPHLITIISLVCALSCGSDTTAPPGNNGGNGNQTITVASLGSLKGWTLQEQATPRSYAFWDNGVLQSAVDIYGTGTCSSLDRSVTALHTRIDFTQYRSCRATFSVHARAHALAWTGFAQAKVVVAVRSNVPGTPNLVVLEAQAYSDHQQSAALDQSYDLSLANALGFTEGTVEVSLVTKLSEPSTSACQSESFIEIHGFKVEGAK